MSVQMSETQYYQDAGVTVTNARIVTSGHTVAMSGVTSVMTLKEKPGLYVWLMLVLGLGLLLGASGAGAKFFGLLLTAAGAYLLIKPPYVLWLTSSSGRTRALSDRNSKRIFAIAEAINQSIIGRG